MRTRSLSGLLATGLLSAGLLAGCMATAQTDPTASTGASARLRLALNFTPRADLSPYTDDAVSLTRMGVTESLIAIDPAGLPQPALAEKFEQVDEFTAKFTLRAGVKFHDGTAVDAKAVAESLNHALKASPAPATVSGRELTITAEGDNVVIAKSAKADPLLVMRFANPDMAILAPKAYTKDPNKPAVVDAATGPFELVSHDGKSEAKLDANPDYWGGKPKLSGIDTKFISKADSRVSSLRAGELDVVQNVPIAQLANLKDFEIDARPIPRTTGISLNTKSGPLTDAGLRAAVAKAIDPSVITKSAFEGQGDVAKGIFRPESIGGSSQAASLPEAKDPAGTTLTLATWDDRPELPEALTIIADQLRKAGFTVETPVVKAYSVLEPDLMAGKFDLVLGSRMYMSKANDPLSLLQSDFTCKGGYNLSLLCDPAIDSAIESAAPIADVTKRRQAAAQIEIQVLSTGAYIPVLHEQVRIGRTKQVSGLAADPLEWKMVTHETTLGK